MSFHDTIHVRFRASSSLRVANLLVHAAALLVMMALALSRPAFGPLALAVLASAIRGERVLSLRSRRAIVRMRWSVGHQVRWEDAQGRLHRGTCVDARSWGALWVRLRVRAPNRRFARAIVVPFDAVDADMHRRLRARCRVMPPQRAI